MQSLRRAIGLIALAGVSSASATLPCLAVAAVGLESAEEIRQCVRRNLPKQTSEQLIELRSEDRVGESRTLTARLHWKRFGGHARLRIRVDSPADVRGSTYLVIEHEHSDETYAYLPALQKVRRITGSTMGNSLWGTDFSYEDIKQLQGIAIEGQSELSPASRVGDRDVYVLSMTPDAAANSSYSRLSFFIDQLTCVALVTEFYQQREEPRKILRVDPERVRRKGGRWRPDEWEMRDLRDATRSWLRIIEHTSDVDIADRIFNPTLLGRGR